MGVLKSRFRLAGMQVSAAPFSRAYFPVAAKAATALRK